ncbi:nucleotide disphospho-sugar-binding domain-containing protein [Phytohabitans kaempferiae]|uniref:Nucleotide disphospho-sugar-binding domain-containing protein n=1 Tax=Phytohabitans kaempferiae TaxID=1620943 RepID=A0ABV6MHF4_9ACTN
MRALFASPPSQRLHNLVPLAWALRSAGHEAQIAAGSADVDAVNRTGLVAVAADDTDALVEYAGLWNPDVVIWDPCSPAGAVAARSAGVVSVRMRGILDHVTPAEVEPADADATVDSTPPTLRTLLASGPQLPIRYLPYGGPAVVPSWLRRKPRRPRVYVSLTDAGTISPELFDALEDLEIEAICAIAVDLVPPETDLPSNVRLVDPVPLTAILPTCAAVVHDGVALASAAAYGVPQLVLGAGAGRKGTPLAKQLHHILTDPAPRAEADRLREEISAMPSPRDVVPDLVRLARRGAGALGRAS